MPFASDRSVEREAWFHWVGYALFATVVVLGAAGALGDRARIVLHAAAIYLFLLFVFRIAGRRTLAQTTTFDLVLVLIIGDAVQQAMLGEDQTLAGAALAILSLVTLDVTLSHLKHRFPLLDRMIEGSPILLKVRDRVNERAMALNGLDEEDLLAAARERQGLTAIDDIEQATLEKDGHISIVSSARP